MDFNERFVSVSDGLSVFVRDYAVRGTEQGVPVVCIHGLTRNSADFEDVAPALSNLGRRVLAIDVRGRGRSDRDPDPSRYTPEVYARDVVEILDALCIERAVFIGTSMGGLVAMLIAVKSAERIAAVVFNDVGPVVNAAGLARIASYVGKAVAYSSWENITDAIRTTLSITFPDSDDRFWHKFARRTAREDSDGRVVFNYDPAIAKAIATPAAAALPDLRPLFALLKDKPLLVVRGALSDILSTDGVEAMRQIKPDLEYVEIRGVGHAPTLEESAAQSALAAFLNRVP